MSGLAVGLLLFLTGRQEDVDSALEALAPKLAAEGPGSAMCKLLRSDAGRLVIKEKVAALVSKAIERIDRDPEARFERYLFAEDADGTLSLRPERRGEIEALGREIRRREKAWPGFNKAGEAIAEKIPDREPLGKKLKEYWKNPEFRLALYQKVESEAREPEARMLWNRLIGRSLFRGADGKLRLRGNYKDQALGVIAEVKGEGESLAGLDRKVDRLLEKLQGDQRARGATPEGRVLLARRLSELREEGTEKPVAKLLEGGVQEALQGSAALTEIQREIRPILEGLAKDLSEESEHDRNLRRLLGDPRFVVLLALRIKTELDTREDNLKTAIAGFRDDHFNSNDKGEITPKKGRFVDDQGRDSAEALANEGEALLKEAEESRSKLAEIAERMLDSDLAVLFRSREGASAFTELEARVIEDLKEAERESGVPKFIRLYLVKSGEGYRVRPERARSIEELAIRAKEVQKALELAGREEVRK